MNLQYKFGYCVTPPPALILHFVYKRDGIMDGGQTNGQTDGQTIQTLDAPGGPFRPGA